MIARCYLIVAACALCGMAKAEFPLRVQSALIEETGNLDVAGWVDRDRRRPKRSLQAQLQYVIADGVEVQLSLARQFGRVDEDGTIRPSSARELEVVWVPFRKAQGWSWGVAASGSAEASARGRGLLLLGSLPLEGDHERAFHVNLGRERESEDGTRTRRSTANIAYEHGISSRTALLAEVVAASGEKPLRQAGIRYKLAGNLRLGIMLGENRAGTAARIGFLADFD